MKSVDCPSNLERLCISRFAEGPPSADHQCDNSGALAAYWTASVGIRRPTTTPTRSGINIVLLDTRLRPIGGHLIALGSCYECSGARGRDPVPIGRLQLLGFAVMHNHPRGDVSPSEADRTRTRRLREASALMGIRFVDHVVTTEPSRLAAGDPPFFSLREAGLVV